MEMKKIKSANDLDFDACCLLVSNILLQANADYRRAYKFILINGKQAEPLLDKVKEYDAYERARADYKRAKYYVKKYCKGDFTKASYKYQQAIAIFNLMEEPTFKPTLKQLKLVNRYLNSRGEIVLIENWLYSDSFAKLTMKSKQLDPTTIIAKLQEQAKYEAKNKILETRINFYGSRKQKTKEGK